MTTQKPPSLVEYRDPGVELYRGNPLIEALPPILSTAEAMAALARYPAYSGKDRTAPSHLRIHQLNNVLQFFQPLPVHIDLEQRVSRMIRSGYIARNPLQIQHWREIDERVGAIRNARGLPPSLRSTADGFGIIGISGGGKTTAMNEVLRLYPQVLVHSNYQGRTFSRIQLTWLKLECPFDGSVRGLCLNFFDAVDSILQTEYLSAYTSGRQTVDELLPAMARVASLHCLGALVIDEIQHLSHSKSGGARAFRRNLLATALSIAGRGSLPGSRSVPGEFRCWIAAALQSTPILRCRESQVGIVGSANRFPKPRTFHSTSTGAGHSLVVGAISMESRTGSHSDSLYRTASTTGFGDVKRFRSHGPVET